VRFPEDNPLVSAGCSDHAPHANLKSVSSEVRLLGVALKLRENFVDAIEQPAARFVSL
jgi:hypothetical protein